MREEPAAGESPDRVFDEYLVVLSQAGVAAAWDGLARRWTPRLLRYAARVLGGTSESADMARDVVQETWIGAIRGLRRLRDPAQFRGWIYGIAANKCADAIRAGARRTHLAVRAGVPGESEAVEKPMATEQRMDLAVAIRRLPREQRAVVDLFYGEGLTVEEAALALAIPAGTVKSRLHHARDTLKRCMDAAPTGGTGRPGAVRQKEAS